MTDPLNTLDVIMIHRQADGKPNSLVPYNGHQAAHLTACVNLARAILATEKAKQSFISLGDKLVRKSKPHRWWGEDTHMKDVVKSFVGLVTTKWPPLFIEKTLKSPDVMAATFRNVWHGKFNTRDFPISINAGRVDHLCLAARLARADHNTNSKEHQRYRRFMYQLATTMVHEMAHIFITFLTGGESNTPPSEPGGEGFAYGEAGRDLETILFGGHHAWTRNFNEGDDQSGDPHLVDQEVNLYTIDQETIDGTVKYEFAFPLPTVRVMDQRPKATVGAHIPVLRGGPETYLSNLTPPLIWPQSREFYDLHDRFKGEFNPWTTDERRFLDELLNRSTTTSQSGPQSDIYRLASNPSFVPEPVQA